MERTLIGHVVENAELLADRSSSESKSFEHVAVEINYYRL
jgi:hypothetical protein